MKRKVFEIKRDGVVIKTKSAWNASRRFIEDDVRSFAKAEHSTYDLVESTLVRVGTEPDNGVRVWSSKDRTLRYEIRRIYSEGEI